MWPPTAAISSTGRVTDWTHGGTSDNRRLILGPRAIYQPTSWWRHNLQLGLLYEWFTYCDPEDDGVDCRDDDTATWNDCDGMGSLTINREYRLSADYSSDFFLPVTLGVAPTFTLGGYVEDEHYNQKNGPSGSRNAQAFYSQLAFGVARDDVRDIRVPLGRRGHVRDARQPAGLGRPDPPRSRHQTAERLQPRASRRPVFPRTSTPHFPEEIPTWRRSSPRVGKSALTSPSPWARSTPR